MKLTHLAMPVLAVVGVAVAVYTMAAGDENFPVAPPVAEPARSPYQAFVAGAGLVEAATQNIQVGVSLPGVATGVRVKVGDRVQAGQPLFVLEDRQYRSEQAIRESNLKVAEQQLARLRAGPRPEEIPPLEARVAELAASAAEARAQLARVEAVTDARAVSREEVSRRAAEAQSAQSRLDEAKARLALLRSGTWRQDLLVAESQVAAARAQLGAVRTDLERLTVRAPVAGQVLQVNVRPGEYVSNTQGAAYPVVMGDTDVLHVRVDVDENDAWRLRADARAQAALRGNSAMKTPLRFVRTEPYVIPKRSLTGASNERVDTRVLQVIFAFDRKDLPVYVGQQMDVFIETPGPVAPAAVPARKSS